MEYLWTIGISSLALLGLLFIDYVCRKYTEGERATWQVLAQRHAGLTFHTLGPVSSFIAYLFNHLGRHESYLSGRYRHCDLELKTYRRREANSGRIYTRIQVAGPAKPIRPTQTELHFTGRMPQIDLMRQLLKVNPQLDIPHPTIQLTGVDLTERLLPNGLPDSWPVPGMMAVTPRGGKLTYEVPNIQTDIKTLQTIIDLMVDLAHGYQTVLALGGQAVSGLLALIAANDRILKPMALALLADIAGQTRQRIQGVQNNLLCFHCCTRPGPLKVKPTRWKTVTYYGCRSCGQTNHFLRGKTVALLDQTAPVGPVEKDGLIQVNWLARRALFDFDAVEIRNATDEAVERFVMQIGNDTDEWRRKRYAEIGCTVSPDCRLSPNSRRMLARQFGPMLAGG